MRRPAISLKLTLVLAVAMVTLAVTVTGMTFALSVEAERETLAREVELDRIARISVPLLMNFLVVGDLESVRQTLEGLNPDGLLEHVAFYEPDGTDLVLNISTGELNRNAPHWVRVFLTKAMMPMRYPIEAGGKSYGVLELKLSASVVKEVIWGELKLRARVIGILIVVLCLLCWGILSFALRPLTRLAGAAVLYADGDRGVRVPAAALKELVPAVDAFNRMADSIDDLLAQLAAREHQLRSAKENLDEALMVSKASTWISDLRTGTIELSDGWAVLLGREPARSAWSTTALLGRIHAEDRDGVIAASKALVKGIQAEYLVEHRVRAESGEWKWIISRGRITQRDPATGRALTASGINLDITGRKAVETELYLARAVAEAASVAKSRFLANMSHEIRTPMNGILGMAEILLSRPMGDRERGFARTIHESGKALLAILNDVLDFSKIEAGRIELERAPVDLAQSIEELRLLFSESAQAKGVILEVRIAPDVPATIWGDPTRLRQILLNLLGNAVKFTERGAIQIRVDREQSGMLRFEICDTGIGVPENMRESIFEPFKQADEGVTRRHGGTGLGLAIAKDLVELMKGEIGVESRASGGSTFWFRIPIESRVVTTPQIDDLAFERSRRVKVQA